ncbi:NADH-quinone oxidoreductase subunit J family protein [Zhaonella formicivorans]|uniref:NADH-quinone oxidoreductase subunit J family protein n=1 Tax=Zhaonella formicivorans TaxID=2528593 RepID=UPI0010EFFCEF|nr:NADH-quinone oxidoreductase subunit J [Zhaonella formicivorans]
MVSPALFWLLAAAVLACALAVVTLKNIVHSALYLILTFVGIAIVFLFLEADFLALVQILVYAGAVSILLVFAVMLTRKGDMKQSNLFNNYKWAGALLCLGLFLLIERLILASDFVVNTTGPQNTVGPIAEAMLGQFVIPFEIAAILLLVAMVGAIILAKGVKGH